jgi:hypothetical protein
MLKISVIFKIFAIVNAIPNTEVDHGKTDFPWLIELLSLKPMENVEKTVVPSVGTKPQPTQYNVMQNSYILYRILQREDNCEAKRKAFDLLHFIKD